VVSYDLAGFYVSDGASGELRDDFGPPPPNKGSVIPLRHKTYLIGVFLLGEAGQTPFGGHLPDFRLWIGAQRKKRMTKHFLREPPQHIGLVFGQVFGPANKIATPHLSYASIMTCGHLITLELTSFCKENVPLDIGIAQDAWIRREAAQIRLHEVVYNFFPKDIPQVHDIMGKSVAHSYGAGIIDVV
jgi:hypothetical protein